jgi:hypothetical protein
LAFFFEAVSFIWYFGSIMVATQLRLINQVYYVIVSLGMALFYIATASRIFLALRKRSRSSNHAGNSGSGTAPSREENRARDVLRNVTIKLCVSALALILLVVIAPMSLAPFYTLAPTAHPGYLAFWFCLHSVVNLKAFSTILAFNPPQRSAQSTKATMVSTRSAHSKETAKSLSAS